MWESFLEPVTNPSEQTTQQISNKRECAEMISRIQVDAKVESAKEVVRHVLSNDFQVPRGVHVKGSESNLLLYLIQLWIFVGTYICLDLHKLNRWVTLFTSRVGARECCLPFRQQTAIQSVDVGIGQRRQDHHHAPSHRTTRLCI